jgi:hypothetical protein
MYPSGAVGVGGLLLEMPADLGADVLLHLDAARVKEYLSFVPYDKGAAFMQACFKSHPEQVSGLLEVGALADALLTPAWSSWPW